MPTGPRIALIFLIGLLFALFSFLMYAQYAAHWLWQNFGGWVTLGAALAYLGVTLGAIWAAHRIHRAWSIFEPSESGYTSEATEMEYVITASRASPFVQTAISDPPAEADKR